MTYLQILITLVGFLGSTLIGLFAWIGKGTISKLNMIARSVNNIEKDLGILATEHNDLKENHNDLKKKVLILEEHVYKSK
jgi:cell division protein FtsB